MGHGESTPSAARATAASGASAATTPSISQRPEARSPACRPSARARSPTACRTPPPTATSASAARTTSALRASPSPVAIATSTYALASARSAPGRIPTVVPPAALAPRQAASITPPRPPQTSTAPRSASPRPTPRAAARLVARRRGRRPPRLRAATAGLSHHEVDELAGHDDRLHDLLARFRCAATFGAARASASISSLLARGLGGRRARGRAACRSPARPARPSSVAQQRRVGLGPRLLPHAPAGHQLVDLGAEVRGEREDQRAGGGDREAQLRRPSAWRAARRGRGRRR